MGLDAWDDEGTLPGHQGTEAGEHFAGNLAGNSTWVRRVLGQVPAVLRARLDPHANDFAFEDHAEGNVSEIDPSVALFTPSELETVRWCGVSGLRCLKFGRVFGGGGVWCRV